METNQNNLNQRNVGDVGGKKDSFTKKLGDKMERAGEKIAEKAPGLGKKIRDMGDRVEHSGDDKGSIRH